MAKVRVSTFNCENLFSRPKILNFEENDDAREDLNKLVKLDKILAKTTYSAADQDAILELLDELKDFIDLNEMRNKLVGKKAGATIVKPTGRADWVGGIALKRADLPTAAQESTAAVIEAVSADVQCVVEVEDRLTLEHFSQALLKKKPFPFNILIDGNDPRGIDVGLLSKHPFTKVQTHIFDKDDPAKKSRIFSRDCLEVEVALPGGEALHVLVNHFKSQGYGTKASNDARRKLQADRVVEILGAYDVKKDLVVVAGDFNDKPGNAPLAGLLGVANLTDVLAAHFADPKERWTYKDKSQIDYLLVSKPLADAMTAAGVERRGLFQADKLTKNLPPHQDPQEGGPVNPFPSVTSTTTDASDHAAVWAEFNL